MEDDAPNAISAQTTTKRGWLAVVARWGLYVAIVLLAAWIGFAGERVDAWMTMGGLMGTYAGVSDKDNAVVEIWQHGWPFVFLNRRTEVYFSHPFAFWQGFTEFRGWALVGDLLVWGAIIGAVWVLRRTRTDVSPRRSRFSLSLKMLLLFVTFFCVMGASLGTSHLRSLREMEIGANLERLGHHVEYEYIGPIWFSRLVGRDLPWLPIQGVSSCRIDRDAAIDWPERTLDAGVGELANLKKLDFGSSQTDDAGLKRLLAGRRYWAIRELHFYETPVTGAAFESCDALPQLRYANGWGSKLNDKGFAALTKLPRVENINAKGTGVTNDAVDSALQAPHLRDVDFNETNVDRASLQKLIEKGIDCW
ncbi:hypothetical protein LOC68_22855 [Blastopirellula sp. JC732]|uniref:Leucine Rich repeats (2 copies) n=1 Tax=Blastopirellula sediminis TaxID=2894196 RepID=A0A9X1SI70_9BACT|nr:hypothetical protein [Blastopirellula sediminis]MCC9605457.1 hypothetical protein [Blastopirellula sediminis]MCC9631243.1 hypothetical protein [Blastopirellula sediminis]